MWYTISSFLIIIAVVIVPSFILAGFTVQTPTTPLKGVAKRKRAKDGVQNTSRYSFEITADLKAQLERAVLEHQLATGKKVSTSAVIRTAIEKYLKTGKL